MSPAFLFTKLLRNKIISGYSNSNPSYFLQNSCIFLRRISSNTSCADPEYTVSYLVESCGLSPKDALSASEKVHFATPERPDSVLNVLRSHGFNSTQITTLVRKFPPLLSADAEKIISPRLEFFQSTGISTKDLTRIFSYSPCLWSKSLPNHIEPVCSLIKSLVQSDENVATALKRSSRIFSCNHEKSLKPNISLLRKLGMPAPYISLLRKLWSHEQFSAGVSKVKEMGFDPSKSNFVLAVPAISAKGSKLIWDRCHKTYSKWGWSEEDILTAFMKHPHCMTLSEKKIESAMEFLVNTMGWSSKCIAKNPIALLYSLEKRTITRCSVIQVLRTKNLLSKDLSPCAVLVPVEKVFLKKFVTKYEQQVPKLLSFYEGKMDPLDL